MPSPKYRPPDSRRSVHRCCKWSEFRHAKNTKLCLGQSVDGIYFARRFEACTAKLDGQHATQLIPRAPDAMLVRAIFIPFGRVPIAERFSTLHWGLGGCMLQNLVDKSNGAYQKIQAIFIPSTVPAGLVDGGQKAGCMDSGGHMCPFCATLQIMGNCARHAQPLTTVPTQT